MSGRPSRRAVLVAGGAIGLATLAGSARAILPADEAAALGPMTQLGWTALDLGTGRRMGLNEHRRMPMCSSFKWLLAAFVLWRVDHGRERLEREVAFGPDALLAASPVTSAALAAAGGRQAPMTVGALCAAITSVSDNAAANLLLRAVGGPAALTAWLRAQGDQVTICARVEPFNNRVPEGDPRDTTTPAATASDLRRFLFGDALSPASRARLLGWMLGCAVGKARLTAGLPAGWRIAHRTGTGYVGTDETAPLENVEAWMAGVARHVASTWRGER